MLSISNPLKGAGRGDYYLKLAREDYYALEEPGRWHGQAAVRLALGNAVQASAFRHLLDGYSPDGRQPLVQNAGHAQRQSGWDLTLSAPKSVSVLWALAPEPLRAQLEQAHRHAVAATLDYIEREAGVTRRGKGGAIKEAAALVFATFLHGSSRAGDPQLHTHALLVNLGLRADGTSGTLQSRDFFRAKMEAGELYRSKLATQLERLHLRFEEDPVGFHIQGVPRELCAQFSQRRQLTGRADLASGGGGQTLWHPAKPPAAYWRHGRPS